MKRFFVVLTFIVGMLLLLSLGNRYEFIPTVSAATTAPPFSWAKTWGGNAASVIAKNVKIDTAGNIYVAGEFSGTVNFDPAGGC